MVFLLGFMLCRLEKYFFVLYVRKILFKVEYHWYSLFYLFAIGFRLNNLFCIYIERIKETESRKLKFKIHTHVHVSQLQPTKKVIEKLEISCFKCRFQMFCL